MRIAVEVDSLWRLLVASREWICQNPNSPNLPSVRGAAEHVEGILYPERSRVVVPLGGCPVPDCPGELYPYGEQFKCDGRGHIFNVANPHAEEAQ